jgi:hypothetical protein
MSNPNHFFKYVSQFRKKDADLIQAEVDGTSLTTPYETADAYLNIFKLFV